MAIQVVCNFD